MEKNEELKHDVIDEVVLVMSKAMTDKHLTNMEGIVAISKVIAMNMLSTLESKEAQVKVLGIIGRCSLQLLELSNDNEDGKAS